MSTMYTVYTITWTLLCVLFYCVLYVYYHMDTTVCLLSHVYISVFCIFTFFTSKLVSSVVHKETVRTLLTSVEVEGELARVGRKL